MSLPKVGSSLPGNKEASVEPSVMPTPWKFTDGALSVTVKLVVPVVPLELVAVMVTVMGPPLGAVPDQLQPPLVELGLNVRVPDDAVMVVMLSSKSVNVPVLVTGPLPGPLTDELLAATLGAASVKVTLKLVVVVLPK